MSDNNLVIIKIGGSVITDKDSNRPVFRKSVVKGLFSEIKSADKKGNLDFIIVHGGGSFAHPIAKKYKLNEGYLGAESALGTALTKHAVLKLSDLILNEMLNLKLDACLVETSAVATTNNGTIENFNLEAVSNILKKHIIPVLSGDVVIDSKKGISILSGDQIVVYLAKKLKAKKIIFVSDVDGVFDKNPKTNKDAVLIKEVNNKNLKKIIQLMETNNQNDVTGEMKGKILTIKNYLKNTPAVITNGLKKNNLKNALSKTHSGTQIYFATK